jgi:hypothetical protein
MWLYGRRLGGNAAGVFARRRCPNRDFIKTDDITNMLIPAARKYYIGMGGICPDNVPTPCCQPAREGRGGGWGRF